MSERTIESYLVVLGFKVDTPGMRKFDDALKLSAQKAEMLIGGMAKTFVIAGGAIATTLTAVVAGTIGLMDSVAQQDLGYKLLARRMFMGEDAAKKMKIATDALGYSVEEIIWGPPELHQRYRQLIEDQTKMMKELGPDFEHAAVKIRDMRFQFTRFGVDLQYFGQLITKDVIKKLGGDPDSMDKKLSELNEWFMDRMPVWSANVSSVLAPVLRDVRDIFKDMWSVAMQNRIDDIGGKIVKVADALKKIADTIAASPDLQRIIIWGAAGAAGGAVVGSVVPGVGTIAGGVLGGLSGALAGAISNVVRDQDRNADAKGLIRKYSAQYGIDPNIAMAIAQRESGMQQWKEYSPGKWGITRGTSGELGMFQLMPGTAMHEGVDPAYTSQNILGGVKYFSELLQQSGGDVKKALQWYNGGSSGSSASKAYADDVYQDYLRRKSTSGLSDAIGNPDFHRDSYSPGNITVHIQGSTGMGKEEVKRAVSEGIDEANRKAAIRAYAQRQGAYA